MFDLDFSFDLIYNCYAYKRLKWKVFEHKWLVMLWAFCVKERTAFLRPAQFWFIEVFFMHGGNDFSSPYF